MMMMMELQTSKNSPVFLAHPVDTNIEVLTAYHLRPLKLVELSRVAPASVFTLVLSTYLLLYHVKW